MTTGGTGSVLRDLGGAAGFGEIALARSDDGSTLLDARAVFDAGLTWFGTWHSGNAIWVNTNGTLSFGAAFDGYRTLGAELPTGDILGAYWGDVDTRIDGEGAESGQIWVDLDVASDTMAVTWADVGRYRYDASLTNLFQVQMRDRGSGDFDLTLRYEQIAWDFGSADDDGGAMALLTGTRLGPVIDLGPALTLDTAAGNDMGPGLWTWAFRGGTTAGVSPATGLVRDGTPGADVLESGIGNDLLRGGAGSDVLRGSDGADWLAGGDGADTLNGGSGNDTMRGGATDQDLRDVAYGGDGHDDIDGGYGNDLLYGGTGNDTLTGGFGADELIGQEGNDALSGGATADMLFGGDGNDFLNGGFGSDRLNGGTGADQFFHLGIADHGSDWVQDYRAAEGDVLVWGGGTGVAATPADFQVNYSESVDAGISGLAEGFVVYRPTGQILWALVDGADQSAIWLRIGTVSYDIG